MTNPGQHRKRVREIFMQVTEAADTERAALLERLCGDESNLRREVEALLHADRNASADQFMTEPTGTPTASAGVFAVSNEPIGSKIGPYKLLELIGEGGFGAVYVTEQDKPVRRRVALKVIKLGMDTKQVIARFEAERQTLAMMDHANIARVLDAGATASGRPWFAMELVRGVPITEYCDAANLTASERLELFTQVCHAVQHAHQKGVIHRDIKPSNVLVTLHDGKPVPKVIDFGIAKAVGAQLTDKTVYTLHQQMIGTPVYMSPEQAEMSGLDVDTRADVYSLGVLLYELLTGSTPFAHETLFKAGLAEMQRIIREVEPVKPSTRVNTLGDTLPTVAARRSVEAKRLGVLLRGDLDWIAMKCLEKDRGRRYGTANDLAADVQRHLGGELVIAAPPSAAYRLRKFVRKHRGPVLAGSAVAAALVLGIPGTTWGLVRANEANDSLRAGQEVALDALIDIVAATRDWKALLGPDAEAILAHPETTAREQAKAYIEGWKAAWKTGPEVGNPPPPPYDQIDIALLAHFSTQEVERTVELRNALEAANTKLKGENERAMAILKPLAMSVANETPDVNAPGIYVTPPLDDGSHLWICRPARNEPENIVIIDPAANPGLTMDDVTKRFPEIPQELIPAEKAVGYIAKLIEFKHNQMMQEVKRAELAEAEIKYKNVVNTMWDDDNLATIQDVVRTREKWLGSDDIETVRALWSLAEIKDRVSGTSELYEEAAMRLERASRPPDCDLLIGYAAFASECFGRLDMKATQRWLNRIARWLPVVYAQGDVLAADGFYITNIPMKFYNFSGITRETGATPELIQEWADSLGGLDEPRLVEFAAILWALHKRGTTMDKGTTDRIQRLRTMSEALLIDAPGNPHALTALAAVQYASDQPADALASARRAIESRHSANLPACPVDRAIIAITQRLLGNSEEAHKELEMLRDMIPPTSPPTPYNLYLSYAEAVINPRPTPEQQLAEETKQRRLAEAAAAIAESASREEQPPEMLDRIMQAVHDRETFLGRTHMLTVEARLELSRFGDSPDVRARAWGELNYRRGDYPAAISWVDRSSSDPMLAILAMSHYKLGHVAEARAAFDKLQELMAKPEFASDADCQALFKEARELIESSTSTHVSP